MNTPSSERMPQDQAVRTIVNQWSFEDRLQTEGWPSLGAEPVEILQINVGKLCNQACNHCHVEAGPKRTEQMTSETATRLIELMDSCPTLQVVDITGGAPELNAEFRRLVVAARERNLRVIDRCNLTVLFEPDQKDTAAFLAAHQVEIVASLPCYSIDNVDKQRGHGVFDKSIRALQMLNVLGYGAEDSGLMLNLVYNPGGAFLPPAQAGLELAYKEKLLENFGVVFNHLFTITNMPIKRFAGQLARGGQVEEYMRLLTNHFNAATITGLMCRTQISIGWEGTLYDCDFNQMLELPSVIESHPNRPTIFAIDSLQDLAGRRIATEGHCFGCTAGAGSSCGGALE